ncbi:RNA polymerase sigma factor [Spirochaeta lutea]|uniref:RNA polymerase sigma factor n=1 Tax=Spirochaeta lutea TaxID=1480694 RepID=A0A098R1X0_9SPIO|nr:sigma-70 family RNA polymerase sigma factor [Spirochaeta lutea]KGE73984.1 hypothetical protein DC28_02085 [Spirochaeta lutea]
MKQVEFNKIAETHGKRIYNIAFRITCNSQDAEDIAQEVLYTIYNKYITFRGDSDLSTWIYRVAVNTSLRYKSRVSKSSFTSLEEDAVEYSKSIPEEVKHWETNPEDEYLIKELLNEITGECTYFLTFKLSDEQRIVYILQAILGFSYSQISSILEMPVSSVKARLYRARENLISYFSGHCSHLNPKSTCSCGSRVGYAVHLVPEILDRVKKHASKESDSLLTENLEKIPTLGKTFANLPLFDYQVKSLEYYLKGKV